MKELEIKQDIYLEEYDVHVHPYLSLAEIELIVKGVCSTENKSYSDRKMTEDMLIMFYGTDIGKEQLEAVDYDTLYRSGLIDTVRCNIMNLYRVQEAVSYMESIGRIMSELAPQIAPLVQKFGDNIGENTNKK